MRRQVSSSFERRPRAAGFHFGERLLDRVEVGRVGGQEEELGSSGADCHADDAAGATAKSQAQWCRLAALIGMRRSY